MAKRKEGTNPVDGCDKRTDRKTAMDGCGDIDMDESGFERGMTVLVHSLQQNTALNGVYVSVLGRSADRVRCSTLDGLQTYAIKPANLRPFYRLDADVLMKEFHEHLKTRVDMKLNPESIMDLSNTNVQRLKSLKQVTFHFICERMVLSIGEKHPLMMFINRDSEAKKVICFYPVKIYQWLAGIFDDHFVSLNPVDIPIKYAWGTPIVSQYLWTDDHGRVDVDSRIIGDLFETNSLQHTGNTGQTFVLDSKKSGAAKEQELMALASLVGGMAGFSHSEIETENRHFEADRNKPCNQG